MSLRAQCRRAAVLAFLAGLAMSGCGGRNIPPPAIPGLVTIADVDRCTALTVGEDAIWAARDESTGWLESKFELVRISLVSNEATVIPVDVTALTFLEAEADIVWTSDALWLALQTANLGEPVLLKLDPTSGAVVGKLLRRSFALTHAAVGKDGVWVATSSDGAHELLRIDPETVAVSAMTKLHTTVLDIAVTEDAVWALHIDGTLSRIDAATNHVLGAIRLSDVYTRVVSAADSVWLVARAWPLSYTYLQTLGLISAMDSAPEPEFATLARIDPGENAITATIPLGRGLDHIGAPDIFIDGDTIWVSFLATPTEDDRDSVSRLWLAEIDATTNEIRRTMPVGLTRNAAPRIAVVDNDVFVCGSSLWRIPLESLRSQD